MGRIDRQIAFNALKRHLETDLRQQGLAPDKYDADFIIGSLMTKLRDMDAVLTSTGVRRFKR